METIELERRRGDRPPLRLEALRHLLVDGATEPILDRFGSLAAASFGVATASITLADGDVMRSFGMSGAAAFATPRSCTLSARVVAARDLVVVPDIAADADVRATALALAHGGRAYAGAPLIAPDGACIGALALLDGVPRLPCFFDRPAMLAFAAFAVRLLEERLAALTTRSERDALRATIADAPTPIMTTDVTGRLTSWNAAAERLYGWSFDDARAMDFPGVAPERRAHVVEALRRIVADGSMIRGAPSIGVDSAGRRLDVVMSAAPRRDAFGNTIGATVVVEDVSDALRRDDFERRRSEVLELAAADADVGEILDRLAKFVEFAIPGAACAILARDRDGSVASYLGAHMPAGTADHAGRAAVEAARLTTVYATEGVVELAAAAAEAPQAIAAIYRALVAAGFATMWRLPIVDVAGTPIGTVIAHVPTRRGPTSDERRVLVEATSLAAISIEGCTVRQRLERLALHDALTGLPNRALLEQRLEALLARGSASAGFAVAMIDLDRFKVVNDSLGHAVGDLLLVEIANRLLASVRTKDLVARLSGDEFVVVIADVGCRATAGAVARSILASLERPCTPGGHDLFVRASVGIALHPADGATPGDLLRRADAAMYASKVAGTRVAFVEAPLEPAVPLALETDLNGAVGRGELELAYQPAIDARSGDVVFAEALIRWNHPRLGPLPPERFVPIAEQTGLIVSIGSWVLDEACDYARRWHAAGGCGVVSVNVSARQFEDASFVATVATAIARGGIAPAQLWLEITETLIMRSPGIAATLLADLRRLGVRSTIDDFGTGYSSLAYLKRFPIDGIKIDRAFVQDLGSPHDAGDRAIVASIVALGRALGHAVVAEGAETTEQIDALRGLGCTAIQGHYVAAPMSAAAALTWRVGRIS